MMSEKEIKELKLLRILARRYVPVHILDTELMRLEYLEDEDCPDKIGYFVKEHLNEV